MLDKPLRVILCGCFGGRGFQILKEWAVRARRIGVPIYLVPELHPAPTEDSDQIRAASRRAIEDSHTAGVILVILSYKTLQVSPEVVDRTGGLGVEREIAEACGKKLGLLFDDWRDLETNKVSSLLKPGKRELVFWAETPGDLEDLFAKCVSLALALLEEAVYEKAMCLKLE